jgi:hypothetical protein
VRRIGNRHFTQFIVKSIDKPAFVPPMPVAVAVAVAVAAAAAAATATTAASLVAAANYYTTPSARSIKQQVVEHYSAVTISLSHRRIMLLKPGKCFYRYLRAMPITKPMGGSPIPTPSGGVRRSRFVARCHVLAHAGAHFVCERAAAYRLRCAT